MGGVQFANFLPTISAPSFDGIESGLITAPVASGTSLTFVTDIRVWNAGTLLTLAAGSSAAKPAPCSVFGNRRIDILLDDNTWVSGASGSQYLITCPTPPAARTWIAAIMQRESSVNIVDLDDDVSAFLIGINGMRAEKWFRNSIILHSTGVLTPVDISGTALPIYSKRGGHATVSFTTQTYLNSGDMNLLGVVDGVTYSPGSADERYCSRQNVTSGEQDTVTMVTRIPLAIGTHQFKMQMDNVTAVGTVQSNGPNTLIEIPK